MAAVADRPRCCATTFEGHQCYSRPRADDPWGRCGQHKRRQFVSQEDMNRFYKDNVRFANKPWRNYIHRSEALRTLDQEARVALEAEDARPGSTGRDMALILADFRRRAQPLMDDVLRQEHLQWQQREAELAPAREPQLRPWQQQPNEPFEDWVNRLIHPVAFALPVAPVAPVQAGARFVGDAQNIHTAPVVKHIEEMMKRLETIPVPKEQKTLGEIMVACDLKEQAVRTMMDHYYGAYNIYGIDRAYPKALDAVWAYIKSHKERKELEVRLSQELHDNIGMCGQGNLSRLINAVTGYLDGVMPVVPKGELLQNRMAAIANGEGARSLKVAKAKFALKKFEVPAEEWSAWLEAF